MDLRCLLLNIVFISVVNALLAFGATNQEAKRCSQARINKQMYISCYNMNLKEVPQNLKSDVEVLNLSFNRIRKLKANSFTRYTDISALLLFENLILSVEPGTFAPLTSLQEIDLSNNGLVTIPMELFSMPKLRNLYIDSNYLHELHQSLARVEKPIRAPLEYLNLANCELQDIPDIGLLPNLWQLNVSMNPLNEFTVAKMANLCHLRVIDLTKTQISSCNCQQVTNHLMTMGASLELVPVVVDNDACPMPSNRTVDSPTFRSCLTSYELAETRRFWLFTAGCLGGALLVLLLTCCWIYRCRKKREIRRLRKAAQNRKHFVISPRNAIKNRQEDEPLHCDTA